MPAAWACLVLAPHGGIAALVENDLGQLVQTALFRLFAPALDIAQEDAQRRAGLAADLVGAEHDPGGLGHRYAHRAGGDGDLLDRGVTDAALGRVDDALESQIVFR